MSLIDILPVDRSKEERVLDLTRRAMKAFVSAVVANDRERSSYYFQLIQRLQKLYKQVTTE